MRRSPRADRALPLCMLTAAALLVAACSGAEAGTGAAAPSTGPGATASPTGSGATGPASPATSPAASPATSPATSPAASPTTSPAASPAASTAPPGDSPAASPAPPPSPGTELPPPGAGAAALAPPPPPLKQLPRGGRTVFPAHRVVCYYGEGTPDGRGVGKGILGRGQPEKIIPDLSKQAKAYERFGRKVLPCLELVVTVAHRRGIGATRDGDYSQPVDAKVVQRHLDVARKHKMLLVLDFQPGRARFLPQVKAYERFLREPDVGVALDPEWRTPYSRPFAATAGRTTADEVNEVARYVADVTRKHQLPQKLFVVHQFRADMIRGRARITEPRELAMTYHVDGIGGPSLKRSVYNALAPGAPFHTGFKIFYNLEATMSPAQAMALSPRPEMISYQ